MERDVGTGTAEMKGIIRVDHKQLQGHRFEDMGEMDKS